MVAGGGPEQLVVLANRLPVERVAVGDGGSGWRTTTGGLVTLLEPVVRDTRAIWVGYAGTSQPSTLDHDGLRMFVVGLPEADFPGYYEGYANSTIWPLYHDCVSPPAFRRDWWESYVRVNEHRSEEHTSELQSRPHLVCRLLLEKKKPARHQFRPYIRKDNNKQRN